MHGMSRAVSASPPEGRPWMRQQGWDATAFAEAERTDACARRSAIPCRRVGREADDPAARPDASAGTRGRSRLAMRAAASAAGAKISLRRHRAAARDGRRHARAQPQAGRGGAGLVGPGDAGQAFAGICGLQPVSDLLQREPRMRGGVEPVIALRPELWGWGLAKRALEAVADHAREGCGLRRLVAVVDAPKELSHRLPLRCGFERIGIAPGAAHARILYARSLAAAAS
ncbi:GNAT family N-acetyltransferase (plasmid) [Paracoccus pantotrophus]|uniref:GNAT family N-acetyltransferase n=1 Tax=Paracoccus pantotrophus TaxID=82367 RepID=A0AAE6NWP8_PARPN|nr:GNAT family N-acetyltransferase [Paracoccus pantotrophus]RNI15418.1 N-acetyltransferase [Paracoccus pantotrophus]